MVGDDLRIPSLVWSSEDRVGSWAVCTLAFKRSTALAPPGGRGWANFGPQSDCGTMNHSLDCWRTII
jgi:hypothetical protein